MSIQPGQTIPDITLAVISDGIQTRSTQDLFADRKVVLFAVSGAFTPTCSNKHLPTYIKHLDEFRHRQITVMCVAVNDAYTMGAWAEVHHVPSDLLMLADGNATFVQALGLEFDGFRYGMGLRARRFALYAENGVVRQLHVETSGEFHVSSAGYMLAALD